MSNSGPRSELLLLTFASVHGLRLALAAWNSGAPGAATWNVSCSCFASSSLRALAVRELLQGECDGSFRVGGVSEHRPGGLQRGNRKRKHAAKGRRIDRNGGCRQPASGDDLRQQPAERVTDEGRL